MFNGIGTPGIILLVILALLLFGPNKLPELGRAVGRTFREFKDGTREVLSDDAPRASEPQPPVQATTASPDKRLPE